MHTESVSMCVRDQVMAKVQKRQRIITVAFHYQNFALYISEQNLDKTNKITTLKKQEKEWRYERVNDIDESLYCFV